MKSISGVIAAILIVFGYSLFASVICSAISMTIKTMFTIPPAAENWFNLALLLFWLFWLVRGFMHAQRTLS